MKVWKSFKSLRGKVVKVWKSFKSPCNKVVFDRDGKKKGRNVAGFF